MQLGTDVDKVKETCLPGTYQNDLNTAGFSSMKEYPRRAPWTCDVDAPLLLSLLTMPAVVLGRSGARGVSCSMELTGAVVSASTALASAEPRSGAQVAALLGVSGSSMPTTSSVA